MKLKLRLVGVQNNYSISIRTFKQLQDKFGIKSSSEEELRKIGYTEIDDMYREYLIEEGCYISKHVSYSTKFLSSTDFLFFNPETITLTKINIANTLYNTTKPREIAMNILSGINGELGIGLDINIYTFNNMMSLIDNRGLEVTVDIKNQMTLGSFLAPTSYVIVSILGRAPLIEVLDDSIELDNILNSNHIVISDVLNLFNVDDVGELKIEGQENVMENLM